MAAPNKKNALLPRLVEMNQAGMTVGDACVELGVHPVTASKWFREEGITPRHIRTGRRRERVAYVCQREGCGKSFEDVASRPRKFCTLECANLWQKACSAPKTCPCGKQIELAEGAKTMYTYRKYCSDECRALHGQKRQPNPENHITFTCQNEACGKSVTRRKGLGYHKYCSNECARTHTKTKQHFTVDGTTVLDSTWEVLVWGKCGYLKVPIERYDRAKGIAWNDSGWYAPDFWLPSLSIALEVKGQEDPEDQQKWTAFRNAGHELAVLGHDQMEKINGALTGVELRAWFCGMASAQDYRQYVD